MIYEAENLQKQIESNNHFSKCLTGSYLDEFNRNRNNLNLYKAQYDGVNSGKTNIIQKYNDKKNKEKEYKAQDEIKSRNYENEKKRLNRLLPAGRL